MSELQIEPGTDVQRYTIVRRWFYAVQTRATWSGSWVNRSYIQPLEGVECAGPQIGRMSFKFVFGRIKREDRASFIQEYDMELRDHYIRVLKLDANGVSVLWTGVIDAESLKPGGAAAGYEKFEAFGLCHLLDREPISSADVEDGNGNVVTVDEVPVANRRYEHGPCLYGNRSADVASDGAYFFSPDAEKWTFRDLAKLALAYAPSNGPTFELGGQDDVLDQFVGVVQISGMTPWRLLNYLIGGNRGVGFVPHVSGQTVLLRVFTTVDTPVTIGGITIPANDYKINIDLDGAIDIDSPELIWSVATKYERIEIRGGHILSCFTISHADGTLRQGFTNAAATLYKNAGGGSDSDINDGFRNDDLLSEVYSKHRMLKTWDGMAGTGDGSGGKLPALPICDEHGDVKVQSGTAFFPMGKCFEEFIPIEEGKDYTVDPPSAAGQPDDVEPTYHKPFALVKEPDANRYHFVEKPGPGFEKAAADFGIYPRDMAFKVEAKPRHFYGKGSFEVSPAPAAYDSVNEPLFSWEKVLATVALRTGQQLKLVATIDGFDSSTDLSRTKLIDIPEAEYWYCVPGTVIGINEDLTLSRYAGSGILRDDSVRLKEVAAAALAWYGRDRAALTLSVRRIEVIAPLGSLIMGVMTGQYKRNVNSVVTSIGFDFGETPRTTHQTQFVEMDFGGNQIWG